MKKPITITVHNTEKELSPREHEVALLVTQGYRDGEIAEQLDLAPSTVTSYMDRVRKKLGAHNRVGVALWVVFKKLVELKGEK